MLKDKRQEWKNIFTLISQIKGSSLQNTNNSLYRPSNYTCRIGPAAAAAAKSLQSCPTLCDPIDRSPPSSPVPGILQGRTLEWVAISFSNAWKWKVKVKSLSCVQLLVTPWTAAHQAPPHMGSSRQEYWGGLPLPSPRIGPKDVVQLLSCVWLFITPWTVTHYAPLSMGFPDKNTWVGCHSVFKIKGSISTGVFIVALFVITNYWKLSKCSPGEDWWNKYPME